MVQYTNKWLTDHLLQKARFDASMNKYISSATGGEMSGALDISTLDSSLIISGFQDGSTFFITTDYTDTLRAYVVT